MSRSKNLDKFQALMFDDMKNLDYLTPSEQEQVRRYRFAFSICLDDPSVSDKRLCNYLMHKFSIGRSQAYADVAKIKVILTTVRNAGKEWIRYVVNEELKQAIRVCKLAGDDLMKERIMAIDKLAKYNKLDKDDNEEIPWEEIIPIDIEPTSDPTVLDITPLANKKEVILKLYEKYVGDIEIETIEYKNINDPDEQREEEDILQR